MLDLQRIMEISQGVDEHLRKLEAFLPVLRGIKASLDELRLAQERNYMHELQKLKQDVGDVVEQLKKRGLPHADKYERELHEIRQKTEDQEWPQAVPHHMICDNEDKEGLRAEAILDLLVGEHLKDKSFLDYGCGHGHVVVKATERATRQAIGYDVDGSKFKFHAPDFTTDFEYVKSKAPYDVVLMHDVLDHIVLIDPIQALSQARSVMSRNGRLYVRNHPWCSRHGGHLYQRKNKAFLHLVFDQVELTRIGGFESEPNVRVLTPLETYRYWFSQAGFKIVSEIPVKDKVEEFFLNPSAINTRIRKHFPDPHTMVNYLEISFVEYVLEPIGLNQQIL